MDAFLQKIEIRWSDLDANRHVRHSAYNDFAAHARVKILEQIGLNMDVFAKLHFGPVLFREETVYRRELSMTDSLTVSSKLKSARRDGSRWSVLHEFIKNDNDIAATLTVDGAWIDLQKRKLTSLPQQYLEAFLNLPRTDDFVFDI